MCRRKRLRRSIAARPWPLHVTFGVVQSRAEDHAGGVEDWAKILAAVPDSRLIVLAYSGGQFERHVREIMSEAASSPGRVDVVDKRPRYEYLRLFHQIDIALDTFPFNGHTTVCDALWMGVPSIMLEGDSYASRVRRQRAVERRFGRPDRP